MDHYKFKCFEKGLAITRPLQLQVKECASTFYLCRRHVLKFTTSFFPKPRDFGCVSASVADDCRVL